MRSSESRSFAATKSKSAPRSLAARKKFRPMRPNPLMPIFVVMEVLLGSWPALGEPILASGVTPATGTDGPERTGVQRS